MYVITVKPTYVISTCSNGNILIFLTDGSSYAEGIIAVYSNFKSQNY